MDDIKWADDILSRASKCHSFRPSTRVLMADGKTKPIKDVKVGDKVKATDPQSGRVKTKKVTATHSNTDAYLTRLTVRTTKNGRTQTAVLSTTENHPFWDETTDSWIDAGRLIAGTSTLRSLDGSRQEVATVVNYIGRQNMRDLTVADIHTYYVLAGTTPVLVHNCDRAGMDFTDVERQRVYDANLEINDGVLKCEYCGRDVVRRPSTSGVPGRPDDAQIDHIEPRAEGGHGGAHNGAVACRRCNRDKSTKPLEVWDGELRDLLDE
jgi:hypothetical protein